MLKQCSQFPARFWKSQNCCCLVSAVWIASAVCIHKSKKRKLINTALCVSYTWNTQAVRDYQHSTVDSFLMLFNVMLWEKIFVLNSSILLCIVMSLSVSMRQLNLYFVRSNTLAYGRAEHAHCHLPTHMKRCCGDSVVFCYSFKCWVIIISTWMSPQLHRRRWSFGYAVGI